jgi:hypothetical protein
LPERENRSGGRETRNWNSIGTVYLNPERELTVIVKVAYRNGGRDNYLEKRGIFQKKAKMFMLFFRATIRVLRKKAFKINRL